MSTICQCCGQTIRAKRATRVAKSFTGYDDFVPAFNAARQAAIAELGPRWYLVPGASIRARVPTAWVACKVYGRTSTAPRDQRFPAAQFWADGALPAGPDYEAVQCDTAAVLQDLRAHKAKLVASVRRELTNTDVKWGWHYIGGNHRPSQGAAMLLARAAERRQEVAQIGRKIRFAMAA